jgi:GNAT superfamily N-acetyltransferase
MSVAIRPAREADVDGICRLLHEQMNRKIAPERWRRLMAYRWLAEKPDLGRVAVDGERIAGYVGMVYSDRELGGRRERIVNICAWYLDRFYRGRGLGFELMRSATTDPSMSYTILTSSARTLPLLDAVGYRVLDADRLLWRRSGGAPAGIGLEEDLDAILPRIDPAVRRMLTDHAGLPVRPVLVRAGGEDCLLVVSVKLKGDDVAYFDVLHLGAPAAFARHVQAIADGILPAGRAVLAVDRRLLRGEPAPGGAVETIRVPRFFKSTHLRPDEIDNLYSEVQLLDLKLE